MVRIGGETVRGYDREWFEDAFARYLPRSTATPATPSENTGVSPDAEPQHAEDDVATQQTRNPSNRVDVAGVATQQGGYSPQKGSDPGLEPLGVSFWSSLPGEVLEPDPDEEARVAMQEGA